jgi:hypothetical protein
MSDELRVRRMVHRLEADDPLLEGVLVSLRIFEEVELRLGRTYDEDLTTPIETARYLMEEPVLVVRVISGPQRVFVGVPMNVKRRRANDQLFEAAPLELEDAGLPLVDPNDCVLHGALNH